MFHYHRDGKAAQRQFSRFGICPIRPPRNENPLRISPALIVPYLPAAPRPRRHFASSTLTASSASSLSLKSPVALV